MASQNDIRTLLKESILKLCAISVPQGLGIEVDGIICISLPGDDLQQIVVKVHEKLDKKKTDELLGVADHPTVTVTSSFIDQPTPLTKPACVPTDCKLPEDTKHSNGKASSLKPDTRSPSPNLHDNTAKIKVESNDHSFEIIEKEEIRALDLSTVTNIVPTTEVPCEYCQLLLPNNKALLQHWKKIHKAIVCTQCQRPFIKQASYLKHLETHLNDIPSKRGPGRPKGSLSKLPKLGNWAVQAIKNRGSLVESKCGVCGDMQPQDVIIKHMIDYHYLEHCFTCQQCAEYFPNRQSLVVHRRLNHSNVSEVRCTVCDVFFYNWEITSHMKECSEAVVMDDDCMDSPQKRPRTNSSCSDDSQRSKKIKTTEIINNGDDTSMSNGNGHVHHQAVDMSLDSSLLDTSQLSPEQEDEETSQSFASAKMNFEDGLPIFYKQTGVSNAPPIPPALGPFRCSLCDKLTLNIREFGKHNFESHYRYTCPFCAQTFATKRNVRRHMRKHTGDRPYHCAECQQSFYRNDDLRRHRVHVHEKLYSCLYCQPSHRLFTKVEMEDHLLCQHKFTRANITEDELAQHIHAKPIPE